MSKRRSHLGGIIIFALGLLALFVGLAWSVTGHLSGTELPVGLMIAGVVVCLIAVVCVLERKPT